jgi:hypothetical protein
MRTTVSRTVAPTARTTARIILTTTRTARRKADKATVLLRQGAGKRLQELVDWRPLTVLACKLQEPTKVAESTVEVVKDRQYPQQLGVDRGRARRSRH